MYYRINISKQNPEQIGKPFGPHYVHYFATADNSLTDEHSARIVFADLKQKFPEPEFKVECTYWVKTGKSMRF